MPLQKSLMLWSGGKDAALALGIARQNIVHEITALLTTVDPQKKRVSMHDVRASLIRQQAEQMGIPLRTIPIAADDSEENYRAQMLTVLNELRSSGITHIIAGDIHLGDVRDWREDLIREAGLEPVFPLWQKSTADLMNRFIEKGYKAIVICTNAKYLGESWLGRPLDKEFLDALPPEVDPCGEKGEFHTFVFDGPNFEQPVSFQKGTSRLVDLSPDDGEDVSYDTRFWYLDLHSS